MQKTFITKSAAETVETGRALGKQLAGGELVLLFGDLGAGKTQLTKGIALALGVRETVVSPTFTIERMYEGSLQLHHFDLYRTHSDREIYDEILDLLKDKQNVIVVEWSENMNGLKELATINVFIEYLDEDNRKIRTEFCK